MPREESWDIAAPLRKLLEQRGWSQARLAAATGIAREDINRFVAEDEPKRRKVGVTRARRIADALSVTVMDLGLPPEEDGAQGKSVLDRLQSLEDEADRSRGILEAVLEGLRAAGIQVPLPEAAPQSAATAAHANRRKRS